MESEQQAYETIYEQITFENIEKYRSFDLTAEMDEQIYKYIEVLRIDEQPESVIEVLRFLGRSSLRVTGVSFPKYETIADGINKSMSTVKRAIRTLKQYGMIKAIPTTKKWLGRGKSRRKSVNIIVIQPQVNRQNEPATDNEQGATEQAEKVEKQTEPSNYNHSNSYVLETAETIETAGTAATTAKAAEVLHAAEAVKNAIPKPIYDALNPFFNAKELQRITGIIFRAKAHRYARIRIEDHADDFKTVLIDCIRRYKKGYIRSLDGYIFRSIKRLTKRLFLTAA